MSQIRLSSDPCITSTIYGRSNWNLNVAHLQNIFFPCVKFENSRTKASYQGAADKVLYKYPEISQIWQIQTPVISTSFDRSKWNLDFAHLQYIFFPCVKFEDSRTEASYQSAADKVVYKYPKISQIRLSSNPRNFDNFWSIKLKPRRCTFTIYIYSLCEVSNP